MRYALLSDVHANLPALEAVLTDIARRPSIAATYHLGDLVGYAPWPNETVALLQERAIAGIAGNYDSTVGDRLQALWVPIRGSRAGAALPPELCLDARPRIGPDEGLPGRPAIPPRPASGRRAPGRPARRAGARHADAQYAVLDGGAAGGDQPQDGRGGGAQGGQR